MMARTRSYFVSLMALLTLVMCLSGCGGGGATATPPAPGAAILVSVTGPADPIAAGASFQFVATVANTPNTAVIWSIDQSGGTSVGSISASGLYTAPATSGTFTVRATSAADGTTSGTANVSVNAPVASVSVSPTNPKVGTGGTIQLTAIVSGVADHAVIWSVEEGAAGGTISPQGLYTAPGSTGIFHVRATAVADPAKYSRATVTVSALGGFRLYPAGLDIAPGGSWDFQAFDDNTPVTGVSWSIVPQAGTLTASGRFTAGSTLGNYTLTGINSLTQQASTAQIRIVSNVTMSVFGFADGGTLFVGDGANFQWDIQPAAGIDRSVVWDMQEGPAGGTFLDLDWYRIYLSASAPGTYHARATPTADPSKVQLRSIVVVAAPSVPAFQPTANTPSTSRNYHAAVAVADGRVVMAGGWGGNPGGYLSSIELFEPASKTFSLLPASLAQARAAPVLAPIDTNRVLVAGGETAYDSASNTGEIINIQTGSVTAAGGTMRVRRMGHQVTVLNNGKVLITGGMDVPNFYGSVSATADSFDPLANTFSPLAQNMIAARVYHSATRLNDGRVLIVGGQDGTGALSSAEIFDPATGVFTSTAGGLADGRANHTASLLADGRVLIAGGNTNSGNSRSCEIFNPVSGTFSAGPNMQEPRISHTATRLNDGQVLVTGGNSGSYRYHGTAETFSATSNSWAYSGRMGSPREGHVAVLLPSGKVLISGDRDNKANPTAEISN